MKNYTITFNSRHDLTEQGILSLLRGYFTMDGFKMTSSPAPQEKVKYPQGGARNIRRVLIKFKDGRVDKNRVEDIVRYWSSLPFVTQDGQVLSCDFAGRVAQFNIDCSSSASHNIDSRFILETLVTYLENGTPTRQDGTRCFDFGCEGVEQIVGVA